MLKKGHILIVSGCAGSGKGTVLTDFRAKCDRVYYSVSCTTRPMRPGEIDGVHYHFKTREEFEDMLKNGEFAEHNPSSRYTAENGKHFFTCKTKACTAIFDEGDCVDSNKDHRCDVCLGDYGTHEAAAGTHICDYCGLRATRCEDYDSNKDHVCELCGGAVRNHAAYSGEHICRYCGGAVSECVDKNRDDRCDICKEPFEGDEKGGAGVVIVIVIVLVIVASGVLILVLLKKRKR